MTSIFSWRGRKTNYKLPELDSPNFHDTYDHLPSYVPRHNSKIITLQDQETKLEKELKKS
jgi:hypothetical protein